MPPMFTLALTGTKQKRALINGNMQVNGPVKYRACDRFVVVNMTQSWRQTKSAPLMKPVQVQRKPQMKE